MKLSSSYVPTLDGWRAIAILGVITAHALRGCTQINLHGLIQNIVSLGQNGVNIFFGLSGFLISLRLLEEHQELGSISLKHFYLRRAFRILPPALIYLFVIGCLGLFSILRVSRSEWISSMIFLRNYTPALSGYGWYTGHFWSLAIEEHFYLFWPVLLLFSGQRIIRWTVPILIAVICIWRNLELHHGYLSGLLPGVEPSQRTDIRADSLLCGCMIALLIQIPSILGWFKRVLCLPIFLALSVLYVVLVLGLLRPHLTILLQALITPMLILATVMRPKESFSSILETKPFRWIGRLSYSLYLWQQLFIIGFGSGSLSWLQRFPWNIGALLVAAAASYYLIEKPLIRLGHHFGTPIASGNNGLTSSNKIEVMAAMHTGH